MKFSDKTADPLSTYIVLSDSERYEEDERLHADVEKLLDMVCEL